MRAICFPLDLGSLVEQGRIDVLDRFANLHETCTAGVVDNTLVQITSGDILTNGAMASSMSLRRS